MLRSEEAYSGLDEGPFQTLVKHDMTDRQFYNPLKGTVSPLVKTVPGYACCPQRLEAKSKLEILYRLAIRQIRKIVFSDLSKYDLTSVWLQDAAVKQTFVIFYVIFFSFLMSHWYLVIFKWAPPPVLQQKTSAVLSSNVWSSISTQTQSVCKIALSYQASCYSTLYCCRSVFSLVKSTFHKSFKTDFIKCSISKWAPPHPGQVRATCVWLLQSTSINSCIFC